MAAVETLTIGLLATISDAEPDRRPQRTEQISRALRLLFCLS
jgi:hypothetical protein